MGDSQVIEEFFLLFVAWKDAPARDITIQDIPGILKAACLKWNGDRYPHMEIHSDVGIFGELTASTLLTVARSSPAFKEEWLRQQGIAVDLPGNGKVMLLYKLQS